MHDFRDHSPDPSQSNAADGKAAPGKSPLIVQRSGASSAPSDPAVVQPIAEQGVAGGGGEVPFRSQMEQGFNTSFQGVSFHGGGDAVQASKAIGADAYTMGNSIAMASTPTPQLVAHELAHVVQQSSGAGPSSGVGAAGDSFEQEADHAASQVASGGTSDLAARYGAANVGMAGAVQRKTVQRFESGEHAMIGVGGANSVYPAGSPDLTLDCGAQLFMGEIVAFGDFYADMRQMGEAPRQEVEALAGCCRWEAVWYQARRARANSDHNSVPGQVAPGATGGTAVLPGTGGSAAGAQVTPGAAPGAPAGGPQEQRLRNQPHELSGEDPVWNQQLGQTGMTLLDLRTRVYNQFNPVWAFFGISFDPGHQPETGMAMVRATLGRRRFRSGGGGNPAVGANHGENDSLSRPGDPNAPNTTRDPSHMGGDYLDLAQNNLAHFTTDNWDNWASMHAEAINVHRTATTPQAAQMALATDMMGNHFLTDRFSTGHFVDKAELMAYATGMMTQTARAHTPGRAGESDDALLNREMTQAVTACFQDENVVLAWRHGVTEARANGVLGEREAGLLGMLPAGQIAPRLTGVIMGMPWRHFDPSEANATSGDARNYGPGQSSARGSARAPTANSDPSQVTGAGDYHLGVGNLAALQVHDALNAIGFTVQNGRGQQWRAQGDDHMSAESQQVANDCVQESQRQVNSNDANPDAVNRVASYLPTTAWIDPTWIADYFLGQWGTATFDAQQIQELRQFVNGKKIPINYKGGHTGVSPEMSEICHRMMRILFMAPTGASAVQSDAGTGLNISMLKSFLIARLGEMVSMAYLSTSAADLPQAALELYAPRDPESRAVLPRAANDFQWQGDQLNFNVNVTECQPGTYTMVGHVWNRESGYDVNPQGQLYGRGNADQDGGMVTGTVRALGGATNNDGVHGIGSTNHDRYVTDVAFQIVVPPGGTDPRQQRYIPATVHVPREGGFFTDESDRYVIVAGDAGGQCAIGRSNVVSDGSQLGNQAPGVTQLPVATGAGSTSAPLPVATGIVGNAFRWDNNTVLFSLTLDRPPQQDGQITFYIREMDWDLIGSDAQTGAPRAVSANVFANTPHTQTVVHTPLIDNWNDTYIQVFSDQGCNNKIGESRTQGHDRGRIETMTGRNPASAISGFVWSGSVLRFHVEPPNSDAVYVKFYDKDWGYDYDENGHPLGGPSNTDDQIGGIQVVQVSAGNAAVTSNGDSDTYAIVYKDPACTQPLKRSGVHG